MPDINDILGINLPPEQPNSKRKIVEDLLNNILFSVGQGYTAQAGARGSAARSAGIGAALQGPMVLQQIKQQQAQQQQDQALKIQQFRQAMLRGDQDAALKLREAIGNPVAQTDSATTTGLPIPVTSEVEMPIPPVPYPLGGGKSINMPITSAQDAIRASGMAEDQKQAILAKYRPAPQRRLINTPGGTLDQDNPGGGFIPGTAPAPAKAPNMTPFDVWQKQHPGEPIENWLKMNKSDTQEPLVPVDDGKGNVTYTPRSQAIGKKVPTSGQNKPPTSAERKVLGFYERVDNALDRINEMEGDISKMTTADQARLKYAPNIFQTPVGKKFTQAANDFINASLRRESGAAISDGEYARFQKIYFPQPGDDADTLAQKKKARDIQLETFKTEAGKAFSEKYGDEPTTGQRMEQFSPSTKQYRYSLDGGKTWASGKLPPIG